MDCYKGKKKIKKSIALRKEWNILGVRIITGWHLAGDDEASPGLRGSYQVHGVPGTARSS